MKYTIIYEKEEDAFVGHCHELPDAFSYGSTLDELKRNVCECIELVKECDLDIPEEFQLKYQGQLNLVERRK